MLFMICFLCTRGKYLIKATLSVLRYGLYNKAQHLLRSVYTDYSVECIRVPVRKKYGLFWVVDGILEIFNDQKGCQLSMYTTLFIYEFVYALAEGTNPDHVVGKEVTQLEFEDVYATDLTDLIVWLGDAMESSAITLFNWNGKSFIKIIIDKRLLRLCVDEAQNTIYVMDINEENGYELISISVPEIDWNGTEELEARDFRKGKTGKDDVCILLNDA